MLGLLLAAWVQATQGAGPGAAAVEHGATPQGLLWRIEKPGLPPSHLFGTMHSEHPAIVTLPRPVQETLASSARVTLEMLMDPDTIAALSASMLITEGPALPERIDPALYRQTVQAMAAQGVPEQTLRTFKPWAAAMTLMVPRNNTGLFLDRVLYLETLAKGLPVAGLETAAEQMQVFEGLSAEDQVELLRESLRQYPRLDELYAEMRAVYLRRDLDGLRELSQASLRAGDAGLAKRFNVRVILDRNRRMVERMQPGLQSGNTFFAVGALHLPGPEGILELLRQQGYRVSALY
ncbi:MAG: TraB/GumN family protein [Gammaproteobacteria bacterium]